jgi:hypothetical protein
MVAEIPMPMSDELDRQAELNRTKSLASAVSAIGS